MDLKPVSSDFLKIPWMEAFIIASITFCSKSPLHSFTQLHLLSDSSTAVHRKETIERVDRIVAEWKEEDSAETKKLNLARMVVVRDLKMYFYKVLHLLWTYSYAFRLSANAVFWISSECDELLAQSMFGLHRENVFKIRFNNRISVYAVLHARPMNHST